MKFSGGDLDALKAVLIKRVDEEAAQARMRYVTLDPGMEIVYKEKEREAEILLAPDAGDVPLSETPHITAEAAKFGIERISLAIDIVTAAYQWRFLSAHIDSLRTWHKAQIASATNTQQARAAADVPWGV